MTTSPTLWSSLTEHWHLARTLRGLRIHFDQEGCTACGECFAVCPTGCWTLSTEGEIAIFVDRGCIACSACTLQCPEGVIELKSQK
ncbi:MAG: Oxalate oxidoreductase subunit delta [Chloroflexi bacterium]|nr:Oxalate oxidoreductase subunit delta [Chloroflexota bacterium]